MKKSFYTLLFLLILKGSVLAQFGIGGGVNFASETELGMTLRVHYDINEQFTGVLGYSILESNTFDLFGETYKLRASSLDLDVHYHIGSKRVKPYFLAGLNQLRATASGGGQSETESHIGVNLGLGLLVRLHKKVALFTEGKNAFNNGGEEEGNVNQIMFTGGIKLIF